MCIRSGSALGVVVYGAVVLRGRRVALPPMWPFSVGRFRSFVFGRVPVAVQLKRSEGLLSVLLSVHPARILGIRIGNIVNKEIHCFFDVYGSLNRL